VTDAIETDRLTKYYGSVRGIEELSLQVHQGEIFGFLGPNGAGKTTTIRLALDAIRPTSGSIRVLGLDAHRDSLDAHRRIGYMPGELALYEGMKGREMLEYLGNLRGGVEWGFVEELAERLGCDLSRPVRTLSTGNKHKVGLIQALMHRPELLVLDEPTSGLDPLVQHVFYELLDEVKADGRTVFLSSHILPEVERVCDRIGIVRGGRLVVVEAVEVLKERAHRTLEFTFATPVSAEAFSGLPGVEDVVVDGVSLRCTVTGSVDAVIKAAARFEVVAVLSEEPNLEEVFLAYYAEGESSDEGEPDAD
jgi:ABC-2 type transport system ATP-binding protein